MKITASNYMGREQNPFGDKEPPTNWTRGDAAIMTGALLIALLIYWLFKV